MPWIVTHDNLFTCESYPGTLLKSALHSRKISKESSRLACFRTLKYLTRSSKITSSITPGHNWKQFEVFPRRKNPYEFLQKTPISVAMIKPEIIGILKDLCKVYNVSWLVKFWVGVRAYVLELAFSISAVIFLLHLAIFVFYKYIRAGTCHRKHH